MLYAVVLVTLAELVAAEFDPELHAKYLTMPESSFIEYFNTQGYSWKMAEYENIREKYAPCVHFDKESFEKLPLPTHDLEGKKPPINFDLRNFTPCLSTRRVYDQGKCGSCWAFGTATTASDRACVNGKDYPEIHLSEQDFECLQSVCWGGDPIKGFIFWLDTGLVTQKCKPYNVTELLENKCVTKCVNTSVDYYDDKHHAQIIYRLRNDSLEIKVDLWTHGSIQAGFILFEDFYNYKSGIYEHTHGDVLGYHSVRVIGYGVENGIDYWIVANSWGIYWGENGWFRIKAYQEGLDFENYLMTGLP